MAIAFWLLCLIGFGSVWIFTGAGWGAALLAVTVLAPVVSVLPAALAARRLAVSLELPDTAAKGEETPVRVSLRNPTVIPFPLVRAELTAVNRLTGERMEGTVRLSVPLKGEAEGVFTLKSARCGAVEVRLRCARARDWLRLVPLRISCGEARELLVAPDTFDMRLTLPLSVSSDMEAEQYSQERPGSDYAEVFQVRDYVEGDSPKQIHWKLTTKFDRLISRDPGLPLERRALVFWERCRGEGGETPDQSDAMAEVLVTVCRALLQQGVGCRVVWNDDDGVGLFDLELREESDLYPMLPKLLSAAVTGGDDGVERFLQVNGPARGCRVLFIGSRVPARLPELGAGAVTSLLCCEGEGAGRTVRFTPEGYAKELYELDLR